MSAFTQYTLGIDPGVNGALALLRGRSIVWAGDMPTLKAEGTKGRRVLDAPTLLAMIRKLYNSVEHDMTAVLEEVRSMPRDGHVGAFSFGRSYGITETALAANRVPFRTVKPAVWKGAMGLDSNKERSLKRATELMPEGMKWWPLKKHDGRAEAALIALWSIGWNAAARKAA